jgi:hypothetical protein
MTTPPVTTGGNTRWRKPTPSRWIATPATARTRPATRIAPVTVESVASWAARIAKTPPTNDALVPR